MKTAKEDIAKELYSFGPVNTTHKGFCLAKLEKLMKERPWGSYIVMKSTTRAPGDKPLMYIRYKYNNRKVLWYIATKGSESTEPGYPYLYSFPDNYFNVSICPVFFPSCDWQEFKRL